MMFDNVKGYATREMAAKKLNETIAMWSDDIKAYIARESIIVSLPNGRYAPAVRFSNSKDEYRPSINSLLFSNKSICLF